MLTAFSVVLGTLVIQGLTLKPLLRMFDFQDDDPVGREVGAARARALRVGLATLDDDHSPVAETVRQEFTAHLTSPVPSTGDERGSGHTDLHHRALEAARQAVLAMRATDEIGDDAFHQMEEELDWLDMADGARKE